MAVEMAKLAMTRDSLGVVVARANASKASLYRRRGDKSWFGHCRSLYAASG